MSRGRVLCIHPWIYDFAAYDLWIEPIGLLSLASVLREAGYQVGLLDCLDRAHPALLQRQGLTTPKDTRYGCGHYHQELAPKPELLRNVPRYYRRYGLPVDLFDAELEAFGKPDAVLVTSKMTYWYPGPQEAIRRVKARYPHVPVVLGGGYTTLCYQHALEHSGADYVLPGEGEQNVLKLMHALLGGPAPAEDRSDYPIPAHDLVRRLDSAALLTSRGCPMHCSYCASDLLSPGFRRYAVQQVLREIDWCYELGTRHFAFYDDALLAQPTEHIHPILDGILERRLPVDFHTPNAVHARYLDQELAHKLHQANFCTIRMGLETSSPERQQQTGGKVSNAAFVRAARALFDAGFQSSGVAAYVLVGLPGQSVAEATDTIRFAHDQGVRVKLAFYSPIPGTAEWERAMRQQGFPPHTDPLLHNNTLLAYRPDPTWRGLADFKRWVQAQNALI